MKRKILTILFVAAITPCLQGCFILAALGLMGGGTYYVGEKAGKREDERIKTESLIDVKKELEAKQAQENAQDQGISNQINQNYMAGALTSSIAVYPEVRNGVVILHGRVPDAATAERAIDAARKTPGVQRIISNLVIMNQPAVNQQAAQQKAYMDQYQQYMQQLQAQQAAALAAQQKAAPAQQTVVPPKPGKKRAYINCDAPPKGTPAAQSVVPASVQSPKQNNATVTTQPVEQSTLPEPNAPAPVQQIQQNQMAPYPVNEPQPTPTQQQIEPQTVPAQQPQLEQAPTQQQPVQPWIPAGTKKDQSNNNVHPVPQVVAKTQLKEQKTSPPQAANNIKPTQVKAQQATPPPSLSDQTIEKYSEDDDSGYKEYVPQQIKKSPRPSTVSQVSAPAQVPTQAPAQTQTPPQVQAPQVYTPPVAQQVAPQQQQIAPIVTMQAPAQPGQINNNTKVIFVPVPMPTEDNDELYRDRGSYNPAPIYNPNHAIPPTAPVIQNNQDVAPVNLEYTL